MACDAGSHDSRPNIGPHFEANTLIFLSSLDQFVVEAGAPAGGVFVYGAHRSSLCRDPLHLEEQALLP